MAKVIHGGGSNEQLVVTTDKTQAYGLSGDDTIISGGNSSVLLIGGSGNDKLIMMGGIGTLNGGAGKDTFELTYSATKSLSAVIEDFAPSSDKIVINHVGDTAPQLTSRTLKSGDVVWKDSEGYFNLTLKSVRENDYFDGDASKQVWEVLELTNAEREAQGLSALTLSEGLMIGAMSRAQEIAELDEQQKFDEYKHTRPDDSDYKTVLVDEDLTLEQKYHGYAENLHAGAATSEEVMDAWMESTTHQKNILDNQDENRIQSRKLGVGYNYVAVGSTSSHDRFWTQLFADSLQSPETVSLDGLSIATVNTVSTAVMLDDNDNDYSNTLNGATIAALDGNDSISNTGVFVSIAGGDGADTIDNIGANVSINGGAGDDSIRLGSDNLIVYRAGDGNDSVSGFDKTSKLSIIGDVVGDVEYMPVTVDNDIIVNVGEDSITLKDAATLEGIDDYIIDGKRKNLFKLTNGNDTKSYDKDGAIIEARGGNDKITNSGANVSIDAGDGKDTVTNSGDFATISAGAGNDSIVNNGGASVLFVYDSGSDTISGFNETSTLRVSDGDYSSVAIGNDLILLGSTDSIKVLNAAGLSTLNIEDADGEPVTVGDAKNRIGTEGNDAINNTLNDATIQALGGDDTITNSGANVSIDGGAGNDSIDNSGSNVTINSGAGDDSISNSKASVTINAGEGNDYIANDSASVTIDAGAGDNTITSNGRKVSIVSGDGNDFINSSGDSVTIDSGAGSDTIHNSGNRVSIVSGDGNDSVNNEGSRVTIRTGEGDDTITNSGANVTIYSGTGNDSIINNSSNAVVYMYGGGDDTIEGFNDNALLDLGNYASETEQSGDDVLVYVKSNSETIGTITLKDYNGDPDDLITPKPDSPSTVAGTLIANYTINAFITGDDGDDTITNEGDSVTIVGYAGNDSIWNFSGKSVSIDAGRGNDTIQNGGDSVTIEGGTFNTDSIWTEASNVTILGGAGDDSIKNHYNSDSVTIDGGSGDDTVENYASNVSIYGGANNDFISNGSETMLGGSNVTIDGGASRDILSNYGSNVLINGGNDNDSIGNSSLGSNTTIYGGAGDDTVINRGVNVTISTGADDDSVHNYSDSVTIDTGADNDLIYNQSGNAVSIDAGAGSDSIGNLGANVTIDAGNGNDDIDNNGSNVSINLGADNDYIINNGATVTINGDDGIDFVANSGSQVIIDAGDGDDTVVNYGYRVTINTGDGADSVYNSGDSVTIDTGAGNDYVDNYDGDYVSIDAGDGDDTILNNGSNVSIVAGSGNDYVYNGDAFTKYTTILGGDGADTVYNLGDYSFIDLGDGNDSIYSFDDCITLDAGNGDDTIEGASRASSINAGAGNDRISLSSRVSLSSGVASGFNTATTIDGGAGDDTIQNGYDSLHGGGSNVSILGGTGNDRISLSADSKNNFVRYSLGDGNDTVWGINEDDTLNLPDESLVSSIHSGDNIVFKVAGSGEILLVDAWEKPPKITYGDSGSSGGGSGNGGDKGDNQSDSGNGDKGDNQSDSGNGDKGGKSDGGTSDKEGRSSDASGNQSASGSTGRGSIGRGTSTGLGRGDGNISVTPFSSPFDMLKTPAANQYVYTGGNQVINTYQAGEKIFFLTDYTGSFSDGAGNLFFGSSTGALVVQNATDKFIDHYDAAGNPFLKAYTATTAGVIDGRWQAGFEVLTGSAGADAIYAGDGGSQLWGGLDNAADTLVGGNGSDIFIGGKAQGADIFLNASSADVVNLNDATTSDIVATLEADGAITVAFNTGNAIAVQSSEAQSATFQLADGSAYRFNHATKTWQSANQHVYAGSNQIITDYQAGEKILFNATYTGATFDDAGNFLVSSSTGALAVTNATDKVIDLRDATGNDFVKAYAATAAGVIDGRGLAGFEVINGSQGSDAVFAGGNGSQLWGGADNAADTLIGGNGSDIFIGGKAQGADVFLNASSTDVVHLNDATLSDIIGTSEDNGAIAVAFNTGNVIAVQSSEAQSAAFQLADGSAYRYNHTSKSWQPA